MKIIYKLFYSLLSIIELCSCNFLSVNTSKIDFNNINGLSKINDRSILDAIYNFKLEYATHVPGTQLSYNLLWTGYDLDNRFGPSITKEERFYVYQTNYLNDLSFYLVYLPKNIIDDSCDWLETYKADISNSYEYHFDENKNVIDGKGLLYAQKNNITDYLIYETHDISNIPYIIDDYQLSICLEAKTLNIEQNVATEEEINKSTKLFRRYELIFNESNSISKFEFETVEKDNINYVDILFSYIGQKIEAYPKAFENMQYLYCPFLGLYGTSYIDIISADIIEDKIKLPRYVVYKNTKEDLLDSNTDFSIEEDCYGDFKSLFLEAYLSDCEYDGGSYAYGYFDYNKVKTIIEGNFNE